MMNYGYYGSMGIFGGFIMLFVWILVIACIVWLIYWILSTAKSHERNGNKAIDILKERYAKGEIDKKEFEEKKKDLA